MHNHTHTCTCYAHTTHILRTYYAHITHLLLHTTHLINFEDIPWHNRCRITCHRSSLLFCVYTCLSVNIHVYIHTNMYTYMYTYMHKFALTTAVGSRTGWRKLIACLKLQVIFCQKTTNYRALLQKMTYEYKPSYASSPLCIVARLYSSVYWWILLSSLHTN